MIIYKNNMENNYNFDGLHMSASVIPDLDNMLEDIDTLLDFIEKPEMKHLENTNRDMFERVIINNYHEKLPFKIIRLLMEPERFDNLSKLLEMFDMLKNVKSGKADVYDEFKKFNEIQNVRYLYPSFGGKDEFIKKMSTVPEGYDPNDPNNQTSKEPIVVINDPNKNNKKIKKNKKK
jgi:hypothetical protein